MNKIIAITGPSGSGKTTLGNLLKEKYGYEIPRHCTTREKRIDDSLDFYRYLSHERYLEKYNNDEFLLTSGDGPCIDKKYGNFYGILKQDCLDKLEKSDTIIIFVSYRDINRIVELQNSFDIQLVVLKFKNIEKGIKSRITNGRNLGEEQIMSRINNALELEKEYGNIIEKYASSIVYTDELNIEEVFQKVCEDLKINNRKNYYVGFKGNNAICNENFFDGSITLYPTGEKGNVYFSTKQINDMSDINFLSNYKKYLHKEILKRKNGYFIIFNKKIFELCKDLKGVNIVYNSNEELLNFVNDKFLIREYLKNDVSILPYKFINVDDGKCININKKMVFQKKFGSGGDNTYLIDNNKLKKNNLHGVFSVSEYIPNIPINMTLIIGVDRIISFPISAQLISLDEDKFKYKGGDFIYPQSLNNNIIDTIQDYSMKIANKLKKEGYLGIMGIDYIITKDNIYFMEINPRFQASSFLISLELKEKYDLSLAELHTLALKKQNIPNVTIDKINYSFLNCNDELDYNRFRNFSVINNGYYKGINGLIFRKIYKYSLLENNEFEHLNDNLHIF